MADPYQILGVTREATVDEIRKAYRALAKKSHPDLHPGDKAAEARFKEIAVAYGIVGDETKRALFDSGKIDGTGAEQHQQAPHDTYRRYAETHPGFKYDRQWGGAGAEEDDLISEILGRRVRTNMRGADITYTFAVDFTEAINGAKKRVTMADGKTLDITVPPGLKDGQTLRLRGQGQPGLGGGDPGDVLVVTHVRPHPVFHRDGNDIRSILPVTIAEALGGAKMVVETVSGSVSLAVPKGSNTGTVLRLRGKGVSSKAGTGDHLVELRVVLPSSADDAFIGSVVEWESKHPYDPRKNLGAHS